MHIKRQQLQIVAIMRCIYLGSGDEWLVVHKELKQKRKNKKKEGIITTVLWVKYNNVFYTTDNQKKNCK